eukprot:1490308-Amphidinium_carterae.1
MESSNGPAGLRGKFAFESSSLHGCAVSQDPLTVTTSRYRQLSECPHISFKKVYPQSEMHDTCFVAHIDGLVSAAVPSGPKGPMPCICCSCLEHRLVYKIVSGHYEPIPSFYSQDLTTILGRLLAKQEKALDCEPQ